MKVKVRGRCRPGGRGWAAGESCEERVEGVDVKGGDGEGADPGGRVWTAGEGCEERVEGVDVMVKVQTRWRSLDCRGEL